MTVPKDFMLKILRTYPDFQGETEADMPEDLNALADMVADRGDSLLPFIIREINEGARNPFNEITPYQVERVLDTVVREVEDVKTALVTYLLDRFKQDKPMPK